MATEAPEVEIHSNYTLHEIVLAGCDISELDQETQQLPRKESKSPEFIFQFHVEVKENYFMPSPSGRGVILSGQRKLEPVIKTISEDPLACKDRSDQLKDKVADMLSSIGVREEEQGRLIDRITWHASRLAKSDSNMDCPVLSLRVELFLTVAYMLLQDDREESGCGMVPALEIAIQDLEKITLRGSCEDNSTTQCVICIDELQRDSEATRLPCSHVFHSDCIVSWLGKSHMCPICRFKMPVEEEN